MTAADLPTGPGAVSRSQARRHLIQDGTPEPTAAELAHAMAEQGAAQHRAEGEGVDLLGALGRAVDSAREHRAEQAPTLVLPAGWVKLGDGTSTYYRRVVAGAGHVDAAPEGVYVVSYGERIVGADRAFEFGQAITEAAELLAALDRLTKAGAR